MSRFSLLGVLAAFAVLASGAEAAPITYSAQSCNSWFRAVDRNGDGSLGKSERADEFLGRVTLASETDGADGTFVMSRSFFVRECVIGSLGKPQS
jgi:hypothetical protein